MSEIRDMCGSDSPDNLCWFCKKGRHGECMGEIPVRSASEGPHDCTFDTQMIRCRCAHDQ